MLVNRLKKFLHNIINPDQSGFLKGRNIGNNIRLLLDIIDYTDLNDIRGAIFSISRRHLIVLVMIFCSKSLNILTLGINSFLGLKLFTFVESLVILLIMFFFIRAN